MKSRFATWTPRWPFRGLKRPPEVLGGSQNAKNALCVTPIEKKHGLLVDETAESAVLALKSRKNTIFREIEISHLDAQVAVLRAKTAPRGAGWVAERQKCVLRNPDPKKTWVTSRRNR